MSFLRTREYTGPTTTDEQLGKLATAYIHNQMRCKGAVRGNTALSIRNTLAAFAVFSLAVCGSGAPQQPSLATEDVTDAMLAGGNGDEWLTYGGSYEEQRFSPLTQISAENVGELGLAWYSRAQQAANSGPTLPILASSCGLSLRKAESLPRL